MKITKVTYQASYVTGPYLQHRIGFEAEIDGGNGEDEMKALATLKELADAFDKQVNNFEERMVVDTFIDKEIEVSRPSDTKSALIADVKSCKEIKVLETYRLLAKKDPEIQAAYEAKMDELTHKSL
jgi:hypothetical protein